MTKMVYRPDIDGLRAVAVLAVVLFHIQFSLNKGGFVGVDIFFVISGYLITQILARELRDGTYSIVNFYERRIRRILPALAVVLAATLAVGWWVLLPVELSALGDSLLATLGFVSNLHFMEGEGYFAGPAESKPLLHMWSLAVEEQFYLLFPLVLAAVMRWRARLAVPVMWGLAVVSFFACVWVLRSNPVVAFYMAPLRAWELLTGSLLALGALPAIRPRWMREMAGALGLAVIGGCVVFYHEELPFPGVSALVPCVAAALVIASGQARDTLAYRLLAWRPVVWVGLISYSLYLWHWPVIVYGRMVFGDPSKLMKVGMLLLMVLLAAASWRWVERPFRGKGRFGRGHIFGLAGVVCAALALGGVMAQFNLAVRPEVAPAVVRLQSYLNYQTDGPFRTGVCFLASNANDIKLYRDEVCLAKVAGKTNVLLFGDSHAAHLWWGLKEVFKDANIMQITASGCRPLPCGEGEARCTELRRRAYEEIIPALRPDVIVFAGRWRQGEGKALAAAVARLTPHTQRLYVTGPINEYAQPLVRILARDAMAGRGDSSAQYLEDKRRVMDGKLAELLADSGARYVSLYGLMCPAGQCRVLTEDGTPMQFDYGHLTAAGSVEVMERWKAVYGGL